MKHIFTRFLTAGLITAAALTANAAAVTYRTDYDYTNANLKIRGSLGETAVSDDVSLIIIKPNASSDILNDINNRSNAILYCRQIKATDGSFLFDIDYQSETGVCDVILTANGGEDKEEFKITVVSPEDFKNAVLYLNAAAKVSDEEFIKTINDYKLALGFDFTPDESIDFDSAMKKFRKYVMSNPLNTEKSDENIRLFNTFEIIQGISQKTISDIGKYMEKINIDEDIYNDYQKAAGTAARREYFSSKVLNGKIDGIDDLTNQIKLGLVFTQIRYADGYEQAVNILDKYKSVVGINESIDSYAVKKICGTDFNSAEELVAAYKKYKNTDNSSSGGTGGGSGSGGTGKTNTSLNGSYQMPSETIPDKEPVKPVFDDIEGIDWAYEAISALNDLGIINGTGENRFEPNRNVLREEFAKIIVYAMQLDNESPNSNVFNDASENDWFVKFINIAADNGLLQGTGGGKFGVGDNITRQDLAVILFNGIRKNHTPESADTDINSVPFEDKDDVSDYAKEAVAFLYNKGIINGVSESEFAPLASATRAETAKMVWRALEYLR